MAAICSVAAHACGGKHTVDILATDLSQDALAMALSGKYLHKSFREAPAGWSDRWFRRGEKDFCVGPELASVVRFEQADVDTNASWHSDNETWDLVSCRNLLIYFDRQKQDRVVSRFYQTLQPDGLLFLGMSESLSPMAQAMFRKRPTKSPC